MYIAMTSMRWTTPTESDERRHAASGEGVPRGKRKAIKLQEKTED